MVNDQFIHCCECDAVHRVTPFDEGPVQNVLHDAVLQSAADDWRAFRERHAGHKQESLQLTGASYTVGDFTRHALGSIYLEATNGRARYLLRQWRNAADEPFAYYVVAATAARAAAASDDKENGICGDGRVFPQAPAAPAHGASPNARL
jgi:hypothetical protein